MNEDIYAAVCRVVAEDRQTRPGERRILSHGFSFFRNSMKRGEYLGAGPGDLLFQPYRRVIAQHLVILLGSVLCFFLPRLLAAVLIPVKIGLYLQAHAKERRNYGRE